MKTYKIINFDKTNGVLSVVFDPKMTPLGIDVPIDENGLYITGEELDTYIQGFIPTWHLDRVNRIAQGIANELEIEALVEPYVAPTTPEEEITVANINSNIAMWTELEQERIIAKTLVKYGLIPEDPTAIGVTTL